MKKIIRYMEKTAQSYSQDRDSPSYNLEPRTKEPQQHRSKTRQHHQHHAEKRSAIPSAHAHTLPAYTSGAQGPFPIPHDIQKFQYAYDNIWQSVEVFLPQHSPVLPQGSLKKRSSDDDDDGVNDYIGTTLHSRRSPHRKLDHDTLAPPAYTPTPVATPLATGTHTPTPKYWILFIHGGYFRDPRVTASSFHPALAQLVNPGHEDSHIREIQPHIAGYASINYRLSPHERYPQDDDVVEYERRDATWPEQMNDVRSAIAWLQGRYGFGERYLLVGHSVGATMALLACLGPDITDPKATTQRQTQPKTTTKSSPPNLTTPLAVLGISGIYSFPALHAHFGADYEYLTRNAGLNPESWRAASPALHTQAQYTKTWAQNDGRRRWCLLAHSRDDELVNWAQVERMGEVFEGDEEGDGDGGANGVTNGSPVEADASTHTNTTTTTTTTGNTTGQGQILVDILPIKGKHNEVWERGDELARVIVLGVGEMMGLDQ